MANSFHGSDEHHSAMTKLVVLVAVALLVTTRAVICASTLLPCSPSVRTTAGIAAALKLEA